MSSRQRFGSAAASALASGSCWPPVELSTLLDRTLDLHTRTADHAMIPRPRVTTISGGAPVSRAVEMMATGHSRLPLLGEDVDDVLGVICLRDVLALELDTTTPVREVARPAVMVPASVPLPSVLAQLRDADEEFACVVDEYGGLAGVITLEDTDRPNRRSPQRARRCLGCSSSSPNTTSRWCARN